MSKTIAQKIRSLGFAGTILAGVFAASTAGAQDNSSVLDFMGQPDQSVSETGNTRSLRTTLPDMSKSALAGAPVAVEVCAEDGIEGNERCSVSLTFLPFPELQNPLGVEVQKLRMELAVVLENAINNGGGEARPDDVRTGVERVVDSFNTFLDEHSTEFVYLNTLMATMDLHYELIVNGVQEPNVQSLEMFLNDLREVILQLEKDLMSPEERAFREAQEALQEALEEGKSSEEIKELTDNLTEAFESFLESEMESQGDQMSAEEQANMEQMAEMMEALKKALEEMGLTPEEYAELMMQMMQNSSPSNQPPGPPGQQQEMSFEEMMEMFKKQIEMMQKMVKYLKDISEIIEEQETIRNQTLSEQLEAIERGQPADQTEVDRLEGQQEALQDRLETLYENMKNDGLKLDAFDVAIDEMGQAERDLELDRPGEAVPDMDEALEALRAAKQQGQMMMMQMPGSGPGSGGPGGNGGPMAQQYNDSLIDREGNLQHFDNLNEDLGIQTNPESNARDIRDRIIRRQQGGSSEYLDRLLEP